MAIRSAQAELQITDVGRGGRESAGGNESATLNMQNLTLNTIYQTPIAVTTFDQHPAILSSSRGAGRSNGGFTLLEVMISLAIIAIALLAVYGNYSHTIAMNTDQQFNTIAPLLAARVAADFENRALADLTDESGNFGPEFERYGWTVTVEPISSDTLGNIAEDLHSINITVSFNNAEKAFHCQTVRFIRRESGS